MKAKTNTYEVTYTKKVGGEGQIIVKAANEEQALKNAKFSCFTGSDFRNPVQIEDSQYTKPRQQGFYGANRGN